MVTLGSIILTQVPHLVLAQFLENNKTVSFFHNTELFEVHTPVDIPFSKLENSSLDYFDSREVQYKYNGISKLKPFCHLLFKLKKKSLAAAKIKCQTRIEFSVLS